MIYMKYERHTYGRLYTDKAENIPQIEQIMEEIDAFEYEYLPKDFIAVFDGTMDTVPVGKFDTMNMAEVLQRCWEQGIHVFVLGQFSPAE